MIMTLKAVILIKMICTGGFVNCDPGTAEGGDGDPPGGGNDDWRGAGRGGGDG